LKLLPQAERRRHFSVAMPNLCKLERFGPCRSADAAGSDRPHPIPFINSIGNPSRGSEAK